MRRLPVVLSVTAVALLLAACSAAQAPGWTFAPPTPSPTAGASQEAASAGASAGASAAASAAVPTVGPSGGASELPSTPASAVPPSASGGSGGGGATGTVINLTAQNIDFQQKQLTAPANADFTIHFDNEDASTPHNVVIKDSSGTQKFQGDLVTGVATTDYKVPPLPAGTYTFVCAVHANMTGTLTVGP